MIQVCHSDKRLHSKMYVDDKFDEALKLFFRYPNFVLGENT